MRKLLTALLGVLLVTLMLQSSSGAATRPRADHLFSVRAPQGYLDGATNVSPNGRFITFPRDTNGAKAWGTQLFVHDRRTDRARMVSTAPGGRRATEVFSGDFVTNRVVVFAARGPLVPGVGRDQTNLYVKDIRSGALLLVSSKENGSAMNGTEASEPSWSADGTKFVFSSDASDLVAGDRNGEMDVFMKDLSTGKVSLVSRNRRGGATNGSCFNPILSGGGDRVLMSCFASNMVRGDRNRQQDCFQVDLDTGRNQRLSVTRSGKERRGDSTCLSFSPNARQVGILSSARLTPGRDEAFTYDVFIKHVANGRIRRIPGLGDASFADNWRRLAAFRRVQGRDVFVVTDLRGRKRHVVGLDRRGRVPNQGAFFADFSADGRWVYFVSTSTNLEGDRRGHFGVYRERVR